MCLETKNRLKWCGVVYQIAMSEVTTAAKAQIETDYTRDDVMTAEEDTIVVSCYFLSC